MLTRFLFSRGTAMSVGRLFATSVPRWKNPTSLKVTATASLDAVAIKAKLAKLKAAKLAIQKAEVNAIKALKMISKVHARSKKTHQATLKAQLKPRKQIAVKIVARKAKRVPGLAARRRKEKLFAKKEEDRELSNFYTRLGFATSSLES